MSGESIGDWVACWPAMIAVRSSMALIYLHFAVADVGTVVPRDCRRLAAATMERSCCEVMGISECIGYRCHVSEKRKRRVAGM